MWPWPAPSFLAKVGVFHSDDPIVVSLQEKPPTFLTPTFILCKMGMITATLQDC